MPSVISSLMKAQISLLNPLISALDLDKQRRLQDGLAALGARVGNNKTGSRDVQLSSCQAAWVFPLEGQVTKAILYLHGGAYTAGSLDYARGFGGMLAMETGRAAFCLGYRLAPEHPFPAALDDAVEAYTLMLERYQPEDIAFAGESAGGGLCFALALRIKQLGVPMPERIVTLSPWVELSQSLDACQTMGKAPILSCEGLMEAAGWYRDGHDPKDPLVSPLFGEFSGFPPCLIITGGDEILRPESEEIHQKLLDARVDAALYIEEGKWHVYPCILYAYPGPRDSCASRMPSSA